MGRLLPRARRAMQALDVHSATHVLLVQGDSCPMQPCASVLSQIAAEVGVGEAGFQMTHSKRGIPSPKINSRVSRDVVHNMSVSLERADESNWWKRVFAYKSPAGRGPYLVSIVQRISRGRLVHDTHTAQV